jgi:hypothetical protein
MNGRTEDDGAFRGTFDPVQVRVSGLGEGIDPAAHIVGTDPGFEYLWIERDSLVTGKVISATFYDMPVDYGDVVLFDGAPIGHRDDEKRTPRFPLLQKLRSGAYRRYWFRAQQPERGFLERINDHLPAETFFYVHDEKVSMLCHECANAGKQPHVHEEAPASLVSGKFIVPESELNERLAGALDEAIGDSAIVAVPQLFHDLGDAARTRRDDERWQSLA